MEPFKDQFFNPTYIDSLSKDILVFYPEFDALSFQKSIFDESWKAKELKERMYHISGNLRKFLPEDYLVALEILMKVAELKIKEKRTGAGDLVLPDFVEKYGLEHFEISTKALELFTQACTSEFAVRPFIVKYPEKMMRKMLLWAEHKNLHVRRLASEGCRSRLPWAMALPQFKIDPSPIIPILEILRNDETEYVRKSVSNNLNDISKDHPDVVLQIAKRWYGENENINRLVKHALRTLLKSGNADALEILCISKGVKIENVNFVLSHEQIQLGEKMIMNFAFKTLEKQKIRVEYKIHFIKSNGKSSPKIFQWFQGEVDANSEKRLLKTHHFVDHSTRKHFAGNHSIVIVVNGQSQISKVVNLLF
jgi:3-methyladenine DNA glycosylase AlkC